MKRSKSCILCKYGLYWTILVESYPCDHVGVGMFSENLYLFFPKLDNAFTRRFRETFTWRLKSNSWTESNPPCPSFSWKLTLPTSTISSMFSSSLTLHALQKTRLHWTCTPFRKQTQNITDSDKLSFIHKISVEQSIVRCNINDSKSDILSTQFRIRIEQQKHYLSVPNTQWVIVPHKNYLKD